ncbi:MAG: histidine phosphatase family protein [Anaeromyxobacteraceae bacterium]
MIEALALAPGATRLVLVRHCEAEIAVGVLCGRLDPPLSPAGRGRAEVLSQALRALPLCAVYASPALRAVATAEAIAARHGLAVDREVGLLEVDFGALEGLTWAEAEARYPDVCATWLARPHEVVFPGGEGQGDVAQRAGQAVDAILARHRAATVLAVAHAGVNRAVLARAIGAPPGAALRLDQRYGAINVIDCFDDAGSIVRLMNA